MIRVFKKTKCTTCGKEEEREKVVTCEFCKRRKREKKIKILKENNPRRS